MGATTKVIDYLNTVEKNHGKEVRRKLYNLMVEWDGSRTVTQSFYSRDVLDMKLNEALQ